MQAYGILGCFRFLAGYYFLVLTERQFVGSICGGCPLTASSSVSSLCQVVCSTTVNNRWQFPTSTFFIHNTLSSAADSALVPSTQTLLILRQVEPTELERTISHDAIMQADAGHGLFEVKNVELIPLANGNMKGSGREHAAERRYRKLITSGLDLSKDFLVSYSYSLCHTLQANLTKPPSDMFGSRFVWNEYLTRAFRHKVLHCRYMNMCPILSA